MKLLLEKMADEFFGRIVPDWRPCVFKQMCASECWVIDLFFEAATERSETYDMRVPNNNDIKFYFYIDRMQKSTFTVAYCSLVLRTHLDAC